MLRGAYVFRALSPFSPDQGTGSIPAASTNAVPRSGPARPGVHVPQRSGALGLPNIDKFEKAIGTFRPTIRE